MGLKKVAVSTEKSLGSQRVGLEFFVEEGESDLVAFKNGFLSHLLANDMLSVFGGSSQTKIEDLVVTRFDDHFNFEVIVGPAEEIQHLQKDLIVKICPAGNIRRCKLSICLY